MDNVKKLKEKTLPVFMVACSRARMTRKLRYLHDSSGRIKLHGMAVTYLMKQGLRFISCSIMGQVHVAI